MNQARAEQQEAVSEVRVLIDVSGSMKHNDPENLRISALQLLINLLPEQTRAGIWMFAQKSKVLIPFATVDDQWKRNAQQAILQIHSRGLLTNIEEAIQLAVDDWIDHPSNNKRSLILLTDGMVDVAKDFMLSADSRERIVSFLVPILQGAGIQLHTIALSDNADRELMEKLAFDTNGWNETAHNAEQLQRVFFNMFKKAVPQDTVPISGNQFSIDANIKEFSVLLFRSANAQPSRLLSPDNKILSNANKSDSVRWLQEKNYDLVTVSNPAHGKWKINAETDPDNQVMIVTDLKFKVIETPNHLNADDPLQLVAHFTDQGNLISRQDFLDLINIKVILTDAKGRTQEELVMPNPEQPGYFTVTLTNRLSLGKNTFKLVADGKTFSREVIRTVDVVKMPITINTELSEDNRKVIVQLMPDPELIDTSFMSVQAQIQNPDNTKETVDLKFESGVWHLDVDIPGSSQKLIINFSVMAKSKQGEPLTPNIQPLIIDDRYLKKISPVEKEQPQSKIAETTQAVKQESNQPEEEAELQADPEPEAEDDWLMTTAIVAGVNLVLIICGFFMFRMQKKSNAEKQAQLLERLK